MGIAFLLQCHSQCRHLVCFFFLMHRNLNILKTADRLHQSQYSSFAATLLIGHISTLRRSNFIPAVLFLSQVNAQSHYRPRFWRSTLESGTNSKRKRLKRGEFWKYWAYRGKWTFRQGPFARCSGESASRWHGKICSKETPGAEQRRFPFKAPASSDIA